MFGGFVLLVLLVAGAVLVPWPVMARWTNPSETAYMAHRQAQARERGEELEIQHDWVALEDISVNLQRAVLVAEDHRFREHDGIDWLALAEEVRYSGSIPISFRDRDDRRALIEAVQYYRDNQDRIRGRSTLTQQLARNLYLSPDRSLVRKVRELLVARRLERHLSKDRILELYLNVAEWGPGIFGAEAASQAYFGVPAARLTLFQAASLAGTLPHPLTSNPSLAPGRMAWRRDLILGRLGGSVPPGPLPLPDVHFDAELEIDVDIDVDLTPPESDTLPQLDVDVDLTPPAPDTLLPAPPDTAAMPAPLPPPDAAASAAPLSPPGTAA